MRFSLQKTGPYRGYSDQPFPLGAYGLLLSTFTLGSAAVLATSRRAKGRLGFRELLLVGLSTHKLTRLIARDKVSAVVRAPFTRYQGQAPAAEVDEAARGEGLRLAVGQLLGCQYCLGPWVATALTTVFLHRPRQAKVVGTILSSVAISDFLHRGFQLFGAELQQAYSERDILEKVARSEKTRPPPTRREELERGAELR